MDYYASNRIRFLRAKRKWTAQNLADRVGVSRTAVTAWELGLAKPSVANLLTLADVLEIEYKSEQEAAGVLGLNGYL